MDLLATNDDDLKEAEISDSEDVQSIEDDRKRKILIDSVLALNHKKARYNQRTVVGKSVSEFNFGAANNLSKVHIQDLVLSVKDKTNKKKLTKTLKNIQGKKSVINEPLLKHEKEKIDRATAFTKTCEELSLWDNIVWDNRKKEHLQFPAKTERVEVLDRTSMCKYFQPHNSLELEVYKILHGDQHMPTDCQPLSKVEQRALKAMDLKKAQIRRSDLMKYRALLNYQEIKQQWKNKIKSKRYRRVLKREKLEKEKVRVNELVKNDPEKFLDQMKTVEKSRAKERISLKHRGGSKFQKRQMMYAKYDPNTQQRISDMVKKNRELTKKRPAVEEEEDDDDDHCKESDNESDENLAENTESISARGSNDWMRATRIVVKKLKSTPDGDNVIVEEPMDEIPKSLRDTGPRSRYVGQPAPTSDVSLDPKKILDMSTPVTTSIQTMMVENEEEEDEMEEEEEGTGEAGSKDNDKLTLSQAFANDDVIEEFKEEKEAVKERNKTKDIDLTLPGWGSWAGDGLKVSSRKRKQFTKKAPPPTPRKDDPLGHVIINETRDTAISKYQVKELPFPYLNAKDFAASIAAPIGKDWNPQTVVKELVKPKIEIKLGTIIKPIDRSVLLSQKATSRNLMKPPTLQKKHKQRHKRQKKK